MKVGVRDISRKTDFSPATVSNALNHKRGVSKATAEIIFKAARELGYQRQGRLNHIQFVIARKSGRVLDESAFHAMVIEGIEREARWHDLPTTLVMLDLNDHASLARAAELCQDPTGAIILLATEMDEGDFDPFRHALSPLVVLDGWSNRSFLECIAISNQTSMHHATSYLIDRGHTRIGYLHGDPQVHNFRLRYQGYCDALHEAGLSVGEKYEASLGTTLAQAQADMAAWLGAGGQGADGLGTGGQGTGGRYRELPTAFVADNDVLAVGALQALSHRGIRVPEDVSIIGFDDLSLASAATPPLTTIHVPKEEMGALAVRRIVERAESKPSYVCSTRISTTLVERESVTDLRS